jgi:hypothetical protein
MSHALLSGQAMRLACRVVQLVADLDRFRSAGAPPRDGRGAIDPAREAAALGREARKLAASLEDVAASLRAAPRRELRAPVPGTPPPEAPPESPSDH